MNARQTVTHLAVEQLVDHPGNIRDDLGDLSELALSIREHGILQPLTVTESEDGRFLLLAGHRRLGAARKAGIARVPVVIRHGVTDEALQLVLMLVENCQRRDLSPIEKAEAYGALRNRGLTQGEIARQVGVSRATVSHYLTLLELPDHERQELRNGNFTAQEAFTTARALREGERKEARPTGGTRGRPKGSKTTPWFGDKHPLAKAVRGLCDHRGRVKVGGVGCGPCWEQAIRQADELTPAPEDAHDIDSTVVQSVLDGDYKRPCNPAEKREVLKRWLYGGRPIAELTRLTGWRAERYFKASDLLEEEAAS